MKVLGVDPGLNKIGWAILDFSDFNQKNFAIYQDGGLVKTNSKSNLYEKYHQIFNFFNQLTQEHNLQKAAIEETFVNKNNQSSLKLFGARVAITLAFSQNNLPFINIPATSIKKKITDNGRAEKSEIIKLLPFFIKNLPEKFTSEDCSDAVAISYCGFFE